MHRLYSNRIHGRGGVVTNLERIAEWRKGCSLVTAEQIEQSMNGHSYSALCTECTIGLIRAIENDLRVNPTTAPQNKL